MGDSSVKMYNEDQVLAMYVSKGLCRMLTIFQFSFQILKHKFLKEPPLGVRLQPFHYGGGLTRNNNSSRALCHVTAVLSDAISGEVEK